jgi:hypothetical protein
MFSIFEFLKIDTLKFAASPACCSNHKTGVMRFTDGAPHIGITARNCSLRRPHVKPFPAILQPVATRAARYFTLVRL